ncbi:MAG: hypothetical protein U0704_11470 [Candidatus Eisenbacteria bacterium]
MTRRLVFALALSAALLAGCGKSAEKPASSLTEAQRDTALARSGLPGSGAVGKALDVAGDEANRAARMDSLPR